MEDSHQVFLEKGQAAFNQYMREKERVPLRPGVAYPLVKKLLALNVFFPEDQAPVRVILLSRNSPDAGLRVMRSAEHYGLAIEDASFSQGADRFRYAQAFGAHLFLSATHDDVRAAARSGVPSALMLPREHDANSADDVLRIAFDGDSVIFSDESDAVYRQGGLAAFREHERAKAEVPLGAGPFTEFASLLNKLQRALPSEAAGRIRVALVTARGLPALERVIRTLRSWGLELDEAFFCAGRPKGAVLRAFSADVFFDDTARNIQDAMQHDVASGHVLFGAGGIAPH